MVQDASGHKWIIASNTCYGYKYKFHATGRGLLAVTCLLLCVGLKFARPADAFVSRLQRPWDLLYDTGNVDTSRLDIAEVSLQRSKTAIILWHPEFTMLHVYSIPLNNQS